MCISCFFPGDEVLWEVHLTKEKDLVQFVSVMLGRPLTWGAVHNKGFANF